MSEYLTGRRIGFVTAVVGHGGSEVLFADAIAAAKNSGAEVLCWCPHDAAIRSIAKSIEIQWHDWPAREPLAPLAGKPVTPKSSFNLKRNLWRSLVPFAVKRSMGFRRDAQRFAQELTDSCLDLLVVNVNGSEAASCSGQISGVPVVNVYHLSYTTPPGGWVTRWADHRARCATMHAGKLAIHVSEAARRDWCHRCDYPESKTRVIYNGVEPRKFANRQAKREELGLAEDVFAFVVPGRFDPIKGHRVLIEALVAIKDRFGGSQVLFCGDGPLQQQLETQVRETGLDSVVRFLGWRRDLTEILAASDCVVLPSLSENLSVAALESLMTGTPTIVTKVGGMTEAVQDDVTGFVVPPGDPVALGAAILRMMNDPVRAKALGTAGAVLARQRFTRDRMMREYTATFGEVL